MGSFTFLPFPWYILEHFSSNYFFWICFTEISLYWDVTGMMSLGAICTTSLKCGELSTHSMVIVFSCVDIGFPWESIVAENILIWIKNLFLLHIYRKIWYQKCDASIVDIYVCFAKKITDKNFKVAISLMKNQITRWSSKSCFYQKWDNFVSGSLSIPDHWSFELCAPDLF